MPPPIAEFEWSLPVAVASTPDAKYISLRDFEANPAKISFEQLPPEIQSQLVIARLMVRPNFKLAMIKAGMIDQQRAIEEVRRRTETGLTIIRIEGRIIQHMIERAFKKG